MTQNRVKSLVKLSGSHLDVLLLHMTMINKLSAVAMEKLGSHLNLFESTGTMSREIYLDCISSLNLRDMLKLEILSLTPIDL